jgi:hypothetical protein
MNINFYSFSDELAKIARPLIIPAGMGALAGIGGVPIGAALGAGAGYVTTPMHYSKEQARQRVLKGAQTGAGVGGGIGAALGMLGGHVIAKKIPENMTSKDIISGLYHGGAGLYHGISGNLAKAKKHGEAFGKIDDKLNLLD